MDNKTSVHGIGFAGLLTIVLIAFKLLEIINWSWIWVLSPIWISAIFNILLAIFIAFAIKKGVDVV